MGSVGSAIKNTIGSVVHGVTSIFTGSGGGSSDGGGSSKDAD